MPELVPLSGSERSELPNATPAATPIDPSQVITVTVLLAAGLAMHVDTETVVTWKLSCSN